FDADKDSRSGEADLARRGFLQGAAAGALITGVPWIRKAEAANGVRIRAQSSWQPGTVGYKTFENWSGRVKELTSGEVDVQPFPAGAVAGDFEVPDAVRNG